MPTPTNPKEGRNELPPAAAVGVLILLTCFVVAGWWLNWFGGLIDELSIRFQRKNFTSVILYGGILVFLVVVIPCVAYLCVGVIWQAIRGRKTAAGDSPTPKGPLSPGSPSPDAAKAAPGTSPSGDVSQE
jgi:hypothetical protein